MTGITVETLSINTGITRANILGIYFLYLNLFVLVK